MIAINNLLYFKQQRKKQRMIQTNTIYHIDALKHFKNFLTNQSTSWRPIPRPAGLDSLRCQRFIQLCQPQIAYQHLDKSFQTRKKSKKRVRNKGIPSFTGRSMVTDSTGISTAKERLQKRVSGFNTMWKHPNNSPTMCTQILTFTHVSSTPTIMEVEVICCKTCNL